MIVKAHHTTLNPQEVVFTTYNFTSAQALVMFAEVSLIAGFTFHAHGKHSLQVHHRMVL